MNYEESEVIEFFEDVAGVVEATRYEMSCLWEKYHTGTSWIENNSGRLYVVGEFHGSPVSISCWTSVLDGRKILFYEPVSNVVNHEMIREWLKRFLPEGVKYGRDMHPVEAGNFHCVLP